VAGRPALDKLALQEEERFAELAEKLQNGESRQLVLTGAPKDQALGEEIMQLSKAKVVSLCGKTTLGELGAVMKYARLVIANDSGPMHISAGVGTRTLALFGPTSSFETGPIGAYTTILHPGRTMDEISSDAVLQKAQELLK